MNKTCSKCCKEKPLTEFYKDIKGYYVSPCKECRKIYANSRYYIPEVNARIRNYRQNPKVKIYQQSVQNKAIVRKFRLKHKYNITPVEYDQLLTKQDGVCAICHKPETRLCKGGSPSHLAVDHDHTTGKVRGLLCSKCNTVLGLTEDNISLLQNAIKYVKETK